MGLRIRTVQAFEHRIRANPFTLLARLHRCAVDAGQVCDRFIGLIIQMIEAKYVVSFQDEVCGPFELTYSEIGHSLYCSKIIHPIVPSATVASSPFGVIFLYSTK